VLQAEKMPACNVTFNENTSVCDMEYVLFDNKQITYNNSGKFFEQGSGVLHEYTPEMRAMNADFAGKYEVDSRANYLFVLKYSGREMSRDAAGFMPRGSQFGYIFTKDFSSDKEILQAIAHELGHGRLLLKHTFDKDYKLPQAGTDNLMDYTPLATHLAKWQWDLASDPGIAQGVFDRDEDGMMAAAPCIVPKPVEKGTFEGESKLTEGREYYKFGLTSACKKTWYYHTGMEITGNVSEAGWYEIDDYLRVVKRPLTGLMYIQIQEEIRSKPPDEILHLSLPFGRDTLDIYGIKNEVFLFKELVASDAFDEDIFDAFYEVHADRIFQLYAQESKNAHKNVTGKIESISPEFDLAALGIGAVVKKATVGLTKAAIKRLSVREFTNLFRKTSLAFSRQIDDVISKLTHKAKFELANTGEYAVVKGHHPLAKAAFEGDAAYDLNKAFSVSIEQLEKFGGIRVHTKITGQQNSLYTAWKNAHLNTKLTIDDMANIEIQAMKNAGISEDIATGWVVKALENLKTQGVKEIKNIPWNGIN
jgi:hypothetical protein